MKQVIVYWSGTGNTEDIANKIKGDLGCDCFNVSNANVEMYDGIIKGKLAPVYNGKSTTGSNPVTYSGGTANNSRIIASESGYSLVTGTENDYSTLYLDN